MSIGTEKRARLADEARGLFSRGRFAESARAWGELAKIEPRNASVVFNLGSALMNAGDPQAGVKHIARAISMKPDDPEYLAQLSLCQRQLSRMDDAERASEKAVAAGPGNAFANWSRADLLRVLGRYEEAHALLAPLAADDADATLLIVYAGLARRFEGAEKAVAVLRGVLDREGLAPATRAEALFELGRVLDTAGRYDEAFDAFERANEIRRRPWPAEDFPDLVDEMIERWSAERLGSLPRSSIDDERPVFVVGLLRSGSTLCEQILSSHPAVHPGGELPFMREAYDNLLGPHGGDIGRAAEAGAITEASLTRAGRAYLQRLRKVAHKDAVRVTDKMLYNWRHLGLISLMFPRARIIHTVREPLDACVSGYFNDFSGPHLYCNDLRWLGLYARGVARMMEHWKRVLDLPVHTLVYEDLISEQERVTREVIDFCGLGWDEACLHFELNRRAAITRSNEQVREKLFTTSRGRHVNYAKYLGPLREGLSGRGPGGDGPDGEAVG